MRLAGIARPPFPFLVFSLSAALRPVPDGLGLGFFCLPRLCSICVDFLSSMASTPRHFSGLPRPSASCAPLLSVHAFVAWLPVPRSGLTGSSRLMVLIRGRAILPATPFRAPAHNPLSGCVLYLFEITKQQPLMPNTRTLYMLTFDTMSVIHRRHLKHTYLVHV